MFLQNLISLPHSVAELLKYVRKFQMAAVRHFEILFGYSGPPTKLKKLKSHLFGC